MTANKVLDDAVLAVQRDMDATGIAGRLGFDTPAWDDHGYLRVEYKGQYSSHGLHAGEEHEPVAALALIADLAQAVIAEQDWKAWPTCPAHSLGLHPEQASGAALWRCEGGGGHTVAAIGELQRRGRPVARLPTDDLRQAWPRSPMVSWTVDADSALAHSTTDHPRTHPGCELPPPSGRA